MVAVANAYSLPRPSRLLCATGKPELCLRARSKSKAPRVSNLKTVLGGRKRKDRHKQLMALIGRFTKRGPSKYHNRQGYTDTRSAPRLLFLLHPGVGTRRWAILRCALAKAMRCNASKRSTPSSRQTTVVQQQVCHLVYNTSIVFSPHLCPVVHHDPGFYRLTCVVQSSVWVVANRRYHPHPLVAPPPSCPPQT